MPDNQKWHHSIILRLKFARQRRYSHQHTNFAVIPPKHFLDAYGLCPFVPRFGMRAAGSSEATAKLVCGHNASSFHHRKIGYTRYMIRKRKNGYYVLSEKSGKNLGGPYKSKEAAQKRLRQVEYFKHLKG